MASTQSESILTRVFVLICLVQFLGYAQHYILQPTLPLYIVHLGGSPSLVGLVLAAFGATSVLSRPAIGCWADSRGENRVQILGLLGQAFSISLCLIPTVGATMLANGLRGIGWSGMTTGGYMLLASNAPEARRGEASGYFQGVQALASIIFPAVALWIIEAPAYGFIGVFAVAILLAVAGAGGGGVLAQEVSQGPLCRPVQASGSWWRDIVSGFDRNILLAASLLLVSHLSHPCFTSFAVLYAKELGISHFSWFFIVIGVASVLGRPLLGRVSDKIGFGRSLIATFILESLALLIMPFATSLFGMIIAGTIYFLGSAIGSARILAFAMEKAPAEHRGRAMASFSISFPLSTGAGALLNGLVVDLVGYAWMYVLAALFCASGLLLTARYWSSLK